MPSLNNKIRDRKMHFLILTASKLKLIVAQNRKITDKELAQKLGIHVKQMQDVKDFCRLNRMKVNEP